MPHNAFWDRFAGQVNVTGIFPPQNGNYSNVYGDGIGAIIPRIARRTKKQLAVKQPVVSFSRPNTPNLEPPVRGRAATHSAVSG